MYGFCLNVPRNVLLTYRDKWTGKLVQTERLIQILFQEQRFFRLRRSQIALDNRMFVENFLQLVLRWTYLGYQLEFICKLQVGFKFDLTSIYLVLLPAQGHKDRFYRPLKINQGLIATEERWCLLESALSVLIFNIEHGCWSKTSAKGWFFNFLFMIRFWGRYRVFNNLI